MFFSEFGEVGFGPFGEFDGAGFVAKEADLCDSVVLWLPEVNEFGCDVDPLFGLVDGVEVDMFIIPIEYLAVHD